MAKQLQASLEQVGPTTSRAKVRSHTVFVDRPADKGGADEGPLGGEYQLIALGGCFTSHLLAAIRAREFEICDVKVEVTGTLDGTPERFTEFTLSVSATCDDRESLSKAVLIAERACQVVNTLKQVAHVMVTVQQDQPTKKVTV
jgi:putative redox protein